MSLSYTLARKCPKTLKPHVLQPYRSQLADKLAAQVDTQVMIVPCLHFSMWWGRGFEVDCTVLAWILFRAPCCNDGSLEEALNSNYLLGNHMVGSHVAE